MKVTTEIEVPDPPPIKPGIYGDISNHDYHHSSRCAGLSKSVLGELEKSPAHAKAYMQATRQATYAMDFGSALHLYILQPDEFDRQVAVWDGSTTKAKFQVENIGKIVIRAVGNTRDPGMDDLEKIKTSILAHKTAAGLIAKGTPEQSVFWDDEDYGFRCKCRPDWDMRHIKALMDLKSCRSADPYEFAKSCVNFGYDIQAPWYLDGFNQVTHRDYKHFIFLCVEKTPPYAVAVYRADKAFMDVGRAKLITLLAQYAECLKTDHWPGYPDKVIDLRLPSWAA